MKTINAQKIAETVRKLCLKANLELRKDALSGLKQAYAKETNKKARYALKAILDNARIAAGERLAICQDTGLPIVFVELGQDVRVQGDLKAAINRGIKEGYQAGSFRDSIIPDPLLRGRPASAPALINFDLVKGSRLRITVMPKGFGCENKSQLKMFNPTAGWGQVEKFILDSVKAAGPDACPPYVIGVGIGGTADHAGLLAKKALLRKITVRSPQSAGRVAKLEKDLLKKINSLNIGPMGLGGKATALAVNIEACPTHIAGLPVAVNISCHALRSATAVL
jgi:fumarate hydratase subunit alpha